MYHPDGTYPPYERRLVRLSADLSTNGLENWQGEVLASRVTPFEIRVPSEAAGRDLLVTGSLTQEVIRESTTGYLSFHYRIGGGPATNDTTDFEGITFHGFETWFTDVRTDVQDNQAVALRRMDGGDTFFYWVDQFSHWLIIRTNAPDFGVVGNLHYNVDWDGWGEEGSARLETFRPVPEPAVGIVLLLSALTLLQRRRRDAAVVRPRASNR